MTALPNNHFAVQVEKSWSDFEFNEADNNVLMFCTPDRIDHLELPKGSYTIVGMAGELKPSQKKAIIEQYVYSGRSSYYAYKDYSGKVAESEDDIITDPVVSFDTLLSSLSLPPETTLIIKKH